MAAAATPNDTKAKLMADILNIELSALSFPSPLTEKHKSDLISHLHDAPPMRNELSFQTVAYEGAARSAMTQVISDDEKKSLFCMVHGEFVAKSGVDVEHAIAHSHIRTNQIALLSYLNRDHALRNALLLQANMNQFQSSKVNASVSPLQSEFLKKRLGPSLQAFLILIDHA